MREIKFRAWDKDENCMHDWDFLLRIRYANNGRDNIFNDHDHDIMQYTGLKDKNGKEIYEGDIVRRKNGSGELKNWKKSNGIKVFYVYYDNGCFRFTHDRNMEHLGTILSFSNDMYALEQSDIEIIGNIYENPELLGGE